MKQVKTALTALEQAILKLEAAVYDSRKNQVQLNEQIAELKQAIQTTYNRLDKALETYQKEAE